MLLTSVLTLHKRTFKTYQICNLPSSSGTILVFSVVSSSCHVIPIACSCFCTPKGTYYLENYTMDNFEQNSGIGESFHWLKPFYSESNSFLEIKARNDVMPSDQEQNVQVDYILNQNKLSSGTDHIDFYYLASKEDIWISGQDHTAILSFSQ